MQVEQMQSSTVRTARTRQLFALAIAFSALAMLSHIAIRNITDGWSIFGSYWASGNEANHGLNPYAVYPVTHVSHSHGQPTLIDLNLNPPALIPPMQVARPPQPEALRRGLDPHFNRASPFGSGIASSVKAKYATRTGCMAASLRRGSRYTLCGADLPIAHVSVHPHNRLCRGRQRNVLGSYAGHSGCYQANCHPLAAAAAIQ